MVELEEPVYSIRPIRLMGQPMPCLFNVFMITRGPQQGGFDVFRYSRNLGSGNHYSGNLFFAQDFEPRAGKADHCSKTGDRALRKDALGNCSFCFMAGGDCSVYQALAERSDPIFISRARSGDDCLDILLGIFRFQKKMRPSSNLKHQTPYLILLLLLLFSYF